MDNWRCALDRELDGIGGKNGWYAQYCRSQTAALIAWTTKALSDQAVHPLIIIAVFIVSFLAIHPFQDGNGRLSRILTTLLLLRSGYAYVPYSSLESVESKPRSATTSRFGKREAQSGRISPTGSHLVRPVLNSRQGERQRVWVTSWVTASTEVSEYL
jgi:Fic family protein